MKYERLPGHSNGECLKNVFLLLERFRGKMKKKSPEYRRNPVDGFKWSGYFLSLKTFSISNTE